MFDSLDKLRKQPESVRRRYALGISAVLVVVIGGFWAASFMAHLNTAASQAAAADATPSAINAVSDTISEQYQSVKQDVTQSNPFANTATTTPVASDKVIITEPGQ